VKEGGRQNGRTEVPQEYARRDLEWSGHKIFFIFVASIWESKLVCLLLANLLSRVQ
jgi:hypothetical protein